jgi:hypothetical protein
MTAGIEVAPFQCPTARRQARYCRVEIQKSAMTAVPGLRRAPQGVPALRHAGGTDLFLDPLGAVLRTDDPAPAGAEFFYSIKKEGTPASFSKTRLRAIERRVS